MRRPHRHSTKEEAIPESRVTDLLIVPIVPVLGLTILRRATAPRESR